MSGRPSRDSKRPRTATSGGYSPLLAGRREFLRFGGGLAMSSLVMPELFRGRVSVAEPYGSSTTTGKTKTCILVYLLGGPPHMDMWDLKPDGPAEIRGPFLPVSTNVTGMQICELMPKLAQTANKYAIVRSVTQRNSNHTPMIYYSLTGRHTQFPSRDNDIRRPQRDDFPHMGAVLSHLKPSPSKLPGFVAIPEVAIRSSLKGQYKRVRSPLRGGGAGFLGPKYEAMAVNGEPGTAKAIPALTLPDGVTAQRLEERSVLLSQLDRGLAGPASTEQLGTIRSRAIELTGAVNGGKFKTFALDNEPDRVRDRYGRHRFGQAMLLARRLAEAEVPMVAIHFNEMTICDGWDLHSKNFDALKSELLPMVDQSLSALLEDLDQRGKLDETLVVVMGEFGRTPKINRNAGRDHWGECSSVVLAGGGIQGGQVLGSSDRNAAYPASDPVDPTDIQATIYHCLGLNPDQPMFDHTHRPWPISAGKVLSHLL